MNKLQIINNAKEICKNFNSSDTNIKLKIGKNSSKLSKFYNTYDGVTEFLYIAPEKEIENAINNGAIYLEIYYNNKMAGVIKASKLEFPYPFFFPPKSNSKGKDYWGLSGLYIHKKFRGKHLSSLLLDIGASLAEKCQAQGVYADFDYRNQSSMRLISKHFDFIGYIDGRNGAKDEATIYTTFYKDFSKNLEEKENLEIVFDKFECDYARNVLDKLMGKIGSSTKMLIPYGDGYNEVVLLDKPYTFKNTKILMKPYENANQNNFTFDSKTLDNVK